MVKLNGYKLILEMHLNGIPVKFIHNIKRDQIKEAYMNMLEENPGYGNANPDNDEEYQYGKVIIGPCIETVKEILLNRWISSHINEIEF